MEVVESNVSDVINSSVQWQVPLFQRQYEWSTKQWSELWDDIIGLVDAPKDHFFGTIVGQRIETGRNFSVFSIIDGQQRLTTLSLFFILLRNKAAQIGNARLANKITDMHIVNRHEEKQWHQKILLSSDGNDQSIFEQMIMQNTLPQINQPSALLDAYRFFEKNLQNLNKECSIDFESLWDRITKYFKVVRITLSSTEDPYRVFESLNARGKDLSAADLIQNFVFMKFADKPKEQQDIHTTYWKPLEHRLGNDLSEFMRHFLIMKYGRFVRKADVYDAMRNYINEYTETPLVDFLHEINRFSEYYAVLIGRAKSLYLPEITKSLDRIRRLDYTVTYPFLMRIFDMHAKGELVKDDADENESHFRMMVTAVESYIVRRAVCGIPTNSLGRVFAELYDGVNRYENPKDIVGIAHAVNVMLSHTPYPTDKDFGNAFTRLSFYKNSGKNSLCRIVLEKIEEHLSPKESVDLTGTEITIEHVMPQELTDEWKNSLGENWRRIHEQYLHTIGNLTLTGFNSELSNASYGRKQEQYQQSNLKLNRYFADVPQWTEADIVRRAWKIAEIAIKEWRYTGGSTGNGDDDLVVPTYI